ncbi:MULTISPECIES: response regulator [unclassified Pantoea]|uniref:response regulator n=1 Tax=unclassified Pantoea TaxID=2630326 RepID=UPI001CD66081|nr:MULTISPECIES: response regulator [unclassified Pantoea]MCA1175758.1 response regulator [Pantoea sp. alder69]MCA1253238.1 response regulator [Pantoea sp. alder70]MCA1263325.1 response regulator [Pantoea sp. alder81]
MEKVLIVDDHPITRLALKILIEEDNRVVVGEVSDGIQAIQFVKKLQPDLVIIDIDIPVLNGIDVIRRVRQSGHEMGILVLSGKDSEHYIRRCATAGANGFMSKCKDLAELRDAIRAISKGYGFFPMNRARQGSHLDEESSDQRKIDELSPKELDVLRQLARGEKVVDIARGMNISDKTVSTYKSRLMMKLELKNLVDVLDFAQRHNLD